MEQAVEKKQEERAWYGIQVITGAGETVKTMLEEKIRTSKYKDHVFQIFVPDLPTEYGKKTKNEIKALFQTYLFIDMILDDDLWYIIRNTPNVVGLLGSSGHGAKPTPILPQDMERFLKLFGIKEDPEVSFKVGDHVRILTGPFVGQIHQIEEVNLQTNSVIVFVETFGRPTELHLEFSDVKLVDENEAE